MSQEATVLASRFGLEPGTPDIQSVGPITFGPDGILFVADNQQAAIFAIATDDTDASGGPISIDGVDSHLAAFLGCPREDVGIRDLAVHPVSDAVYFSVTRGSGDSAAPALLRLAADGSVSEVPLEGVPFARATLEDAPSADDDRKEVRVLFDDEDGDQVYEVPGGLRLQLGSDSLRTVTVTDMAYSDGTLLVAGASNEEFASTLRRVPFPFADGGSATGLEIFHVSHGKWETHSPIRSFVPFGDQSVLASYTCTPVVHFSLADLQGGARATGRTVAELGAMNTPIDMVSYTRDGDEYLLVSNTRHPLMRIPCGAIEGQSALTEPREPVGVPRDNLAHEGVGLMANLSSGQVLMAHRRPGGAIDLRSYSAAEL